MDCRGTEKRKWIIGNYDVEPVAHIQLLAGQTKHSDAAAIIENDYYIFNAINKNNGTKEIIQCGMGAARDFLRLLNRRGLPLFNPLCGDSKSEGGKGSGGRERLVWDPIAKQLYNAIMWLIIAWDAKPGTALFEFRSDIIKYKEYRPFDWKVKRVNSTIINGGKGKTLTEIIDILRVDNEFREEMCQFNLLAQVINDMKDEKGKPLNIQAMF